VYEVIEGELELAIDGVKQVARPGLVGIVPSNVRRSVKALTDGRAIIVDYGDKFDESKLKALPPGSFYMSRPDKTILQKQVALPSSPPFQCTCGKCVDLNNRPTRRLFRKTESFPSNLYVTICS